MKTIFGFVFLCLVQQYLAVDPVIAVPAPLATDPVEDVLKTRLGLIASELKDLVSLMNQNQGSELIEEAAGLLRNALNPNQAKRPVLREAIELQVEIKDAEELGQEGSHESNQIRLYASDVEEEEDEEDEEDADTYANDEAVDEDEEEDEAGTRGIEESDDDEDSEESNEVDSYVNDEEANDEDEDEEEQESSPVSRSDLLRRMIRSLNETSSSDVEVRQDDDDDEEGTTIILHSPKKKSNKKKSNKKSASKKKKNTKKKNGKRSHKKKNSHRKKSSGKKSNKKKSNKKRSKKRKLTTVTIPKDELSKLCNRALGTKSTNRILGEEQSTGNTTVPIPVFNGTAIAAQLRNLSATFQQLI